MGKERLEFQQRFWVRQNLRTRFAPSAQLTLSRHAAPSFASRGFLAAAGHDAALCSDFLLGVTSQPPDQVPAAKALLPRARPAAAADRRPTLFGLCSQRWTRGEPRARRSRTARRGCSKALTPASLRPPPSRERRPPLHPRHQTSSAPLSMAYLLLQEQGCTEKNLAWAEDQGTGHERPQKIRGEVSHGVRRAREGVRREL